MLTFRLAAAAVCVLVSLGASLAPGAARQLGTMSAMPFWGKPYPHYYVYRGRWPDDRCIAYRPIWTFDGTTVERVWICPPVIVTKD